MAFTFVQSIRTLINGSPTSTIILPNATAVGDLVIVHVKISTTDPISSVVDNKGNQYNLAIGPILVGSVTTTYSQYYGVQAVGGATTITINATATPNIESIADEFNGNSLSNATVFDKGRSANNPGNAITSLSVAAFSPVSTGELISLGLGFTGAPGTITPPPNYGKGTTAGLVASFYKLNSSSSETAPTSWVNSTGGAEIACAYFPSLPFSRPQVLPKQTRKPLSFRPISNWRGI